MADRAGRGLGRGHRRHGAAFVRLPLRRRWPDLTNAPGPPPILQKNVDEGRIGFKTKRGFFEWDDESIAHERARYEKALRKCLEIFKEEGIL